MIMLTIKLKSKEIRKLNLINFEREKSLYDAWKAMRNDKKYENKKFKVGNELIKISDIEDCIQEDYKLIKGNVNLGKIKKADPQPKQESKQKPEPTIGETIVNHMNASNSKKIDLFIELLKSKGVYPDYNDPGFQRICKSIIEDHDLRKMPFYANLYKNYAKI